MKKDEENPPSSSFLKASFKIFIHFDVAAINQVSSWSMK